MRNVLSALSIYPIAIGLLPLLAIPYILVYVQPATQKGLWALLILGIACLCVPIALYRAGGRPALRLSAMSVAALAFAALAALSALVNGISFYKFFGEGLFVGTGGSFLLFAAAVVFGSWMSRGHMRLHYVLLAFSAVALIAIYIVLLPFSAEVRGSIPITGTDMMFVVAAGLLAAMALSGSGSAIARVLLNLAAVACAALLFFINQPFVMLVAVGSLGALLLWRALARAPGANFPWVGIPLLLFLVGTYVFGLGGYLSSQLDVRPTMDTTASAISQVIYSSVGHALLGSGPDTFSSVWEQIRPLSLNEHPTVLDNTSVSDVVPRDGYTTLLTWLTTIGFMGVASFMLCFVALLYYFWKALVYKKALLNDELFIVSVLVACIGLAISAGHTIGQVMFLLTGVALGVASGLAHQDDAPQTPRISSFLFCAALFVIGVVSVFPAMVLFTASSYHLRGAIANSTGDYVAAERLTAASVALWPLPYYLRDAARASFMAAQNGGSATMPTERVMAFAERAVRSDEGDYRNWLTFGTLATGLITGDAVKKEDSWGAGDALLHARKLAPTRAEVVLAQASLSYTLGNFSNARLLVDETLRLRADYPAAKELLLRLQGPTGGTSSVPAL